MPARLRLAVALAGALALGVVTSVQTASAHADVVAYLVNVTVRPGYNFADAEAAVHYGQGLCGKLSRGHTYAQLISGIEADFATADEYHAAYLLNQAVNELCPALIWQLRHSAAHY
ncbi:DUF732 domain-containing protein [Mycobacterium spongiae]|uniref:DUF732 domain-containing protein n=1 Tax=Mycobacterium spongiae TaxID=886343 RepID=A0A975PZL5_9MYCO|nr:DUF732 domain-containing protein [Mycobacterium spongiae]QUR69763.1 DUF732 domain-containing protein [Mycobacterium spongiae]